MWYNYKTYLINRKQKEFFNLKIQELVDDKFIDTFSIGNINKIIVPSWSADETKIAFYQRIIPESEKHTGMALAIADLDAIHLSVKTVSPPSLRFQLRGTGTGCSPALWSPNDEKIIFAGKFDEEIPSTTVNKCLLDINSGKITPLPKAIFLSWKNNYEIYVIIREKINGSSSAYLSTIDIMKDSYNHEKLIKLDRFAGEVSLSPDCKSIFYAKRIPPFNGPTIVKFVILDIDSGESRDIDAINSPNGLSYLKWIEKRPVKVNN